MVILMSLTICNLVQHDYLKQSTLNCLCELKWRDAETLSVAHFSLLTYVKIIGLKKSDSKRICKGYFCF